MIKEIRHYQGVLIILVLIAGSIALTWSGKVAPEMLVVPIFTGVLGAISKSPLPERPAPINSTDDE